MKPWARLPSLLLLAAVLGGCTQASFYSHFVPYYFAGKPPKPSCGEGPGFKYCLHAAPKGEDDASSVLYFLHYAGGSERSWRKIPISRVYYDEFRKRGLKPPQVVTISFGTHWTLFDEAGPRSPAGRFDLFVSTAMPFVENQLGLPKTRAVWGMSQGGLNAAELVLRRPDLWSAAVLSCPALWAGDIYASKKGLADQARKAGVKLSKLEWGMDLVRERLAGPRAWAKENPLERAKQAAGLPAIYVGASPGDELGFYEGAQVLAERLREAGQPVVFHEEQGAHCAIDARAAAAFLAEQAQARAADYRPEAKARSEGSEPETAK